MRRPFTVALVGCAVACSAVPDPTFEDGGSTSGTDAGRGAAPPDGSAEGGTCVLPSAVKCVGNCDPVCDACKKCSSVCCAKSDPPTCVSLPKDC